MSGAGASGRSSGAGAGSKTTVSSFDGVSVTGASVEGVVVEPPVLPVVDSEPLVDSEVEGDSSSTTGFSLERY